MPNPRAVVAWSVAGLVIAAGWSNPLTRLLVTLSALALVGLRHRRGVRLRGLLFFLVAAWAGTAVLNLLLSHLGSDAFLTLPGWIPLAGGPLTVEALAYGLVAGLGLVATVLTILPLSVCLEPQDLLVALPSPLHRTGAALSASLNLVPGIARGYLAIQEAQRMRGWRPSLRSLPEVMVPALLTAMEDSIQLAEAMEARGYGGGPRTSYTSPAWTWRDSTVTLGALAAVVLVLAQPPPAWLAYPALTLPALNLAALVACLLLFLPVLLWRSPASAA